MQQSAMELMPLLPAAKKCALEGAALPVPAYTMHLSHTGAWGTFFSCSLCAGALSATWLSACQTAACWPKSSAAASSKKPRKRRDRM